MQLKTVRGLLIPKFDIKIRYVIIIWIRSEIGDKSIHFMMRQVHHEIWLEGQRRR